MPKLNRAKSKPSTQLPQEEITMEDVSINHPGLQEIESRRLQRLRDQSRQNDKVEVNHYVVLVFDSYAQKEEFTGILNAKGVPVRYNMYYAGPEFADSMGIELEKSNLPPHKTKPVKTWAEMVNPEAIEKAYAKKISKSKKIQKKKS